MNKEIRKEYRNMNIENKYRKRIINVSPFPLDHAVLHS